MYPSWALHFKLIILTLSYFSNTLIVLSVENESITKTLKSWNVCRFKLSIKSGIYFPWLKDDITKVIFHQANGFMLNYLRKKMRIPKVKFHNNMHETGNTVSSTIPIALKDCIENKFVNSGDLVLLCGFGVGYSWGATLIKI